MAIVSSVSIEKAKSFKKAAKRGLTQRLRERVGLGDSSDSSSSSSESESDDEHAISISSDEHAREKDSTHNSEKKKGGRRRRKRSKKKVEDIEKANATSVAQRALTISNREQIFPADAELTLEGAEQVSISHALSTTKVNRSANSRTKYLQGLGDPAIMPLGIITLEDVLEGTERA